MDNLWKLAILSLGSVFLFFFIFPTAQVLVLTVSDTATFTVDDTNLYIEGLLNRKTLPQIKDLLADNPQVDTLILVNVVGTISLVDTLEMGYWVRDRGLDTHLTGHIASGGVDLFVAGVNRTMELDGEIGVHSWAHIILSFEGKDLPVNDPLHKLQIKYFETMLGNDEFYWYTLNAASSDDIHYMTHQEIKQYGLLTSTFPRL